MITQLNHMAHIWWQWMGGMFWQVSLLIILVTLIDMAIRRWAWPQVRYVLWGLIFLKLVIPPTWQMPTSVVSWVQPLLEKHISIHVETDENMPGISLSSDFNFLSGDANESSAAGRQLTWQTFGFLAWIAGMAAFFLMLMRKLYRLRKWQHRQDTLNASDSKIPEWLHELLAETSQRLKLKKPPAVVFSEDAVSPAVFGIVRPTLLLPKGYLRDLSREQAEHMLIHELCHLKRGDLWIHWLCLLLQIFYWFNPLLIWTRRQMRHVCEICCDLSVADILRDKTRHYRDTLLKNARELFTEAVEPSLGLLGLFEEPFRIVSRLRWLEKETWGRRKRKLAATLVTSLIMVVFVMPMSGLSQSESQDSEYRLKSVSVTTPRNVPMSREAQNTLVEAQQLFENNPEDLATAREPLIEYLETHPSDSIPLVMYQMLGQFWYLDEKDENHIEEANQVYATASAMFPDNNELLLNYAVTTFELGRLEEAALLFEDYYDFNENHDPKYLEYAAQSYFNAENLSEAKRVYSRLIDLADPPEQRWLNPLINICTRTGARVEAEDYIRLALDYYPTEKFYWRSLAGLYFEEGDYQAGNAILEEAGLPLRSVSEPAAVSGQQQPGDLPNEDRVYLFAEVHTLPKVVSVFPPAYPLEAKQNNITGRVVVEFVVTKEGIPRDERIFEAEPPDLFNEAALEAVRQYRFTPATRNGEPVEALAKLPIAFELDEPWPSEDVPQSSDAGGGGPLFDLSGVDTPPRVLRAFPPLYPDEAKRNNIEGRVILRFVVETDGRAKEPEVVSADPPEVMELFQESALEVIEQYKFEPATLNGVSVPCIVKLPVEFKLE